MEMIYIDCGCCYGDSINSFKKYYVNSSSFDIFAFECNLNLVDNLILHSKQNDYTLIQKAVWTEDATIPLYLGVGKTITSDKYQSSSLMKNKKHLIDKKHPVMVEAIDFSLWLKSEFNYSDYIIVKMNIEGAEYPVLSKMLEDGTIGYINKLYVAWHLPKLQGDEDVHVEIEKQVKQRVNTYIWSPVKGNNPFLQRCL